MVTSTMGDETEAAALPDQRRKAESQGRWKLLLADTGGGCISLM
jgi:hypothetical protein